MNRKNELVPVLEGLILEEQDALSIGEICRMCRVHADYILDLVDYGILEPVDKKMRQHCFCGECVMRILKAVRLQRDMGINLAGVAMILDLLDEIDELRSRPGER